MYVNNVRDKIKELQDEKGVVCENIMDNHVVAQFLYSGSGASVDVSLVTEEYELPLTFMTKWLEDNGFSCETKVIEGKDILLINIPPDQ